MLVPACRAQFVSMALLPGDQRIFCLHCLDCWYIGCITGKGQRSTRIGRWKEALAFKRLPRSAGARFYSTVIRVEVSACATAAVRCAHPRKYAMDYGRSGECQKESGLVADSRHRSSAGVCVRSTNRWVRYRGSGAHRETAHFASWARSDYNWRGNPGAAGTLPQEPSGLSSRYPLHRSGDCVSQRRPGENSGMG
jgi:hypothetical protein